MFSIQQKINELVTTFSLEEILEINDLLPEEVVMILYRQGKIKFPDYMDEGNYFISYSNDDGTART